MVFQYPERQLFAETVVQDVAFGPHNLGLSQDEVARRVASSLTRVGLDLATIGDKSPFELSGGQQRARGVCRRARYGARGPGTR